MVYGESQTVKKPEKINFSAIFVAFLVLTMTALSWYHTYLGLSDLGVGMAAAFATGSSGLMIMALKFIYQGIKNNLTKSKIFFFCCVYCVGLFISFLGNFTAFYRGQNWKVIAETEQVEVSDLLSTIKNNVRKFENIQDPSKQKEPALKALLKQYKIQVSDGGHGTYSEALLKDIERLSGVKLTRVNISKPPEELYNIYSEQVWSGLNEASTIFQNENNINFENIKSQIEKIEDLNEGIVFSNDYSEAKEAARTRDEQLNDLISKLDDANIFATQSYQSDLKRLEKVSDVFTVAFKRKSLSILPLVFSLGVDIISVLAILLLAMANSKEKKLKNGHQPEKLAPARNNHNEEQELEDSSTLLSELTDSDLFDNEALRERINKANHNEQ